MLNINLPDHAVFLSDKEPVFLQKLDDFIHQAMPAYTKILVLVDELTHRFCLPKIFPVVAAYPYEILLVPMGEAHKTLSTCEKVWATLLQKKADRKALFICLGGGVICDMGGLIAALYKRGLDFIHLPTTLLAQVDASVGAKLAVDFQGVKNMIGLFAPPKTVLIYTGFLKTLSLRDCYNGFAEMLKHALLNTAAAWEELLMTNPEQVPLARIHEAILTKSEIVKQDPREAGIRKVLNIGHTWGHALESWALTTNFPLFHGEAVVLGLVAELYISQQLLQLSAEWINARVQALLGRYQQAFLTDFVHFLNQANQLPRITDFSHYLHQDKKNQADTILLPLVADFGDIRIDTPVSLEQMERGLVQLFETLRAGWGLK